MSRWEVYFEAWVYLELGKVLMDLLETGMLRFLPFEKKWELDEKPL